MGQPTSNLQPPPAPTIVEFAKRFATTIWQSYPDRVQSARAEVHARWERQGCYWQTAIDKIWDPIAKNRLFKKKRFLTRFPLFSKRKNDRFFVILARTLSVVNVGHFFDGPDGPTKFCWPRSKIKGTSLGKWELLKIAKFRPGGWKTARRAAKRPPTGKPKLSRVTSGYGGLMIPLSRVRPTQKNGGYIGVA